MEMDFQVENTSIECIEAYAPSNSNSEIDEYIITGNMKQASSVEPRILFIPRRNEDIYHPQVSGAAPSETISPARESFRLFDLPVELLMSILAHELYIGHDGSAPPILIFLGAARYENL